MSDTAKIDELQEAEITLLSKMYMLNVAAGFSGDTEAIKNMKLYTDDMVKSYEVVADFFRQRIAELETIVQLMMEK